MSASTLIGTILGNAHDFEEELRVRSEATRIVIALIVEISKLPDEIALRALRAFASPLEAQPPAVRLLVRAMLQGDERARNEVLERLTRATH